jgi:GxxExxY protein
MQAVVELHNTLDPGFGERAYLEALTHELESRNKPFERQKEVRAYYEKSVVGVRRPGFVADGKIVLDLKAVSALLDLFKQQTLSCVRAAGLGLGILVGFGAPRVDYVRVAD